jgi:sterol desaturase/sphingolipid hydroxylase (fatty acid hydroxylase superfamily)
MMYSDVPALFAAAQHGWPLPWMPVALAVWLVHMAVFHGVGLGFQWCDRTGAFRRCKVRNRDRLSYAAMLPRVLFNQTCVLLPAMLALEFLGLAFTGPSRLAPIAFLGGLVVMGIGHDIVQYSTHRWLLHNRALRWLRHDIHHATGASRSIGACYMSAADFFLNIVCPYLVPLMIARAGSDLAFHFVVAGMGAIGGLYEHSGYDFATAARGNTASLPARLWRLVPPSLVSSHAHGEHHRRSSVSFSDGFGSPGLSDLMFRTRWDLR